MSVEELLPCPFCGGEAHLLTGVVEFVDVEVRCWICAAMGGNENDGVTLDENRAAAIAAWNRRTPPAEPHWIAHDGGPNPVPRKMVSARYRHGCTMFSTVGASEAVWWDAVIAYRVTEGVKP